MNAAAHVFMYALKLVWVSVFGSQRLCPSCPSTNLGIGGRKELGHATEASCGKTNANLCTTRSTRGETTTNKSWNVFCLDCATDSEAQTDIEPKWLRICIATYILKTARNKQTYLQCMMLYIQFPPRNPAWTPCQSQVNPNQAQVIPDSTQVDPKF